MDGFREVRPCGLSAFGNQQVGGSAGFRKRLLPAAIAAALLLPVVGCGGGGAPTESPTDTRGSSSNTQAKSGANTNEIASSPSPENAGSRVGSAPSNERAAPDSGASDVSSTRPQATPPSAAAPRASQPAAAPPTAEQLARWTRAPFEPLQLLAYRDWDRLGLVTCMDKTPDGKSFILGGAGVTVWSVGGQEPEHTLLDATDLEQDRLIRSLAVSPDGKWVAAGDTQGRMTIWNLADRSVIVAKDIDQNDVVDIAVSPDSQQLATISFDGVVSIWTPSLEPTKKFDVPDNSVERIEFMKPGLLAVAGEKVTSWDTAAGTLAEELSPGRYQHILARSPDDQWFVFGVEEGLSFWNVGESKVAAQAQINLASGSPLEFSPDGKYLAIADDAMIRVWDVTRQEVVQAIDVIGPSIAGMCWMPGAGVIVVASENGRTRVWGTPAAGQPLGLAPVHAAVTLPSEKATEPATPAQMLAAIDLRSLPQLPGVENLSDEIMVNYHTAADPKEAESFYRHFLGEHGWMALPATDETSPGSIDFGKSGFRLTARITQDPSATGGLKTRIDLLHEGNLDLRSMPKLEDDSVQVVYEGRSTVLYKTKLDLLQIETSLLREMHEAGWTAFSRLHASSSEETDSRDIEFLKNGAMLRIAVQRPFDDPSSYHVQSSAFWTLHALPIPPDSGFVEFDGSASPHLVAITTMSLDEAREFYDAQMTAQGWIPTERGRAVKDDAAWLAYLRGQRDLTIGLVKRPDGRTLVRVGEALENSSWQLATPEQAADPSAPQAGIEAADIPILSANGAAKYDATSGRIEFQMDATPLADVAEKYTAELGKLGFTPKESGIRDTDYTMLTFVKDDVEIDLRANNREGNAQVSLMGDGLLWTKPLPGPKQLISYEAWLRQNRHPSGLERLDQYVAEMKSLMQNAEGGAK
jgi:WD40 repeat protein